MKKYMVKGNLTRGQAAKEMAIILSTESKYLAAPTMAYSVGSLFIERDGSITGRTIEQINELEQMVENGILTSEGEFDEEQKKALKTNEEEDQLIISFPTAMHSSQSIANLLALFYSRGELLSKATGSTFYVDRSVIEDIRNVEFSKNCEIISFLKEYDQDAIHGLSFDEEKVSFIFNKPFDNDAVQTFTKLAASISKMAIDQKRIVAKRIETESEKYSLRIWLLRMGWSGDEYKKDRMIIMRNLSGSAAFRNEEVATEWKNRRKAV